MSVHRKTVSDRYDRGIDMEFIATQNNNKLSGLLSIITECVNTINTNPNDYETNRADYYTKINMELLKIFGFRLDTIYEKNNTPKVYIIPTKVTSNALVKDIGKTIEIYDTVSNISADLSAKDIFLIRARESLNSSLNTTGIKIDLNNATISGLELKYRNIIMIDIRYLVEKYKLTDNEILSELIHEVGHVFDYFISLGFSSDSVSMLIDDIRTEYLGKNRNPKDVLIAYYKKVGGNTDSIKDKNIVGVAIDISKAILTSSTSISNKEEEYSADVFATRFGLGAYLASALRKMDSDYEYVNIVKINVLAIVASIISLVYIVFLPLTVLSTTIYTILIASISGLMSFTRSNSTARTRYNNASYDNMVDRLSRIKQQMITSLQYIDDREISKSMIEQIDATALLISKQKNKISLIDSILKKVSFRRNVIDTKYMVESLLGSDLITAKKRIDLI